MFGFIISILSLLSLLFKTANTNANAKANNANINLVNEFFIVPLQP